ncbi:MAG: hypothetical protein DMG78_08850 [Acidobacteria bacterium]|nr:MAG: hypothetical protein DMG78_08850 [Acidobacteriota bacterium]
MTQNESYSRPIPLLAIVLVSFDANFHIFLASHYAHHWFNPWNEKWFAGFSQTTYPPLTHQWIALVSNVAGLKMGYMLVQLVGVLLLPVGVFRFARIWVDDRASSYAALGSIFLGALAFLIYQAGQLATITSAALYLNALPYFYDWSAQGSGRALVKGVAVSWAAAAAHHVTLIFGTVLFAGPVLWVICKDALDGRTKGSVAASVSRAVLFAVLVGVGVGVVLFPYWMTLIQHPIHQIPIPHDSRANFLLNSITAINYFVIPYGALILALPFIVIRGASVRRLRPLLFGFWLTLIFGLGGTTPLPRWLLGRAFEVLTFERFTFWATLMAMPIVGLLAVELLDRFRAKAAVALSLAAVATVGAALAWLTANPYRPAATVNVNPVIAFLNRDGHDAYRYLTLGFGSELAQVSTYTNASSVDGDYNSARLLPEMTHYGSAQLTNAKFYGSAGMASLRAMLEHANRYGLKYVFVHDSYYEPLLTFVGWRKTETFGNGEITAWSKDDVPPAHRIDSDAIPTAWMGLLWGTLPIGVSVLAIFLVILLPARQPARKAIESQREISEPARDYVA